MSRRHYLTGMAGTMFVAAFLLITAPSSGADFTATDDGAITITVTVPEVPATSLEAAPSTSATEVVDSTVAPALPDSGSQAQAPSELASEPASTPTPDPVPAATPVEQPAAPAEVVPSPDPPADPVPASPEAEPQPAPEPEPLLTQLPPATKPEGITSEDVLP